MIGKGTVISRYNGTTWDAITEVYSAVGLGRSREDISDDDLLDGATETWRQMSPGAKFLQPFNLETRYNPEAAANNDSNQDLIDTDFASNAISYWRLKCTDAEASGAVFSGYVKELGEVEFTPAGVARRRVVIQPTGALFVFQEDIDTYVIV